MIGGPEWVNASTEHKGRREAAFSRDNNNHLHQMSLRASDEKSKQMHTSCGGA